MFFSRFVKMEFAETMKDSSPPMRQHLLSEAHVLLRRQVYSISLSFSPLSLLSSFFSLPPPLSHCPFLFFTSLYPSISLSLSSPFLSFFSLPLPSLTVSLCSSLLSFSRSYTSCRIQTTVMKFSRTCPSKIFLCLPTFS